MIEMGKNKLRICSGKWRGRKLEFPIIEGLRPTADKIRETLFNWLQVDIHGATCLDLFAGSGALGLEAASRGAGEVVLIDSSRIACNFLKKNKDLLQADNINIVNNNVVKWLQSCDNKFDIIFADPPFASGLLQQILNSNLPLKDNGLLYIEHDSKKSPQIPACFKQEKSKKSGGVIYSLYRLQN